MVAKLYSPASPLRGLPEKLVPFKMKGKGKSLSHVRLLVTPWTAAYQAPLSVGFSRQEYWSGVPLPSPYNYLKWFQNLKVSFKSPTEYFALEVTYL